MIERAIRYAGLRTRLPGAPLDVSETVDQRVKRPPAMAVACHQALAVLPGLDGMHRLSSERLVDG
jgi:hypothetical protein